MIEFNGYITGNAEKYFFKRSRIIFQKILVLSLILLLPPVLAISIRMYNFTFLIVFLCIFSAIFLLTFIPKSKKEKKSLLPKKIFTDGEFIISIADKYEDTKRISDVKFVRDFGEFYELVFPFGKVSEKYICQKNLLTKGSIDDFEALFVNKIKLIRKNNQRKAQNY